MIACGMGSYLLLATRRTGRMCIKHCRQLEYCIFPFLQVFQVCGSPPREATNITQCLYKFSFKKHTCEMLLVAVYYSRDEETVCQTF